MNIDIQNIMCPVHNTQMKVISVTEEEPGCSAGVRELNPHVGADGQYYSILKPNHKYYFQNTYMLECPYGCTFRLKESEFDTVIL